ncbi:MAG: hypothetical protein [Microviridae sp.]|nr:MAG: hypothetical protein [Microviridae sp.]
MKFKTQYNNEQTAKRYETGFGISMTIPNQSMTVPEIYARFAQGLTIQGMKIPLYEGDDNLWNGLNPDALDLSEVEAIIKQRGEELAEAKARVNKEVAERRQKAAEMRAREIQREVAEQVSSEKSQYEALKAKFEKKDIDNGVN